MSKTRSSGTQERNETLRAASLEVLVLTTTVTAPAPGAAGLQVVPGGVNYCRNYTSVLLLCCDG